MILVMPSGSTGTFTDKEWANGIGLNNGWETYVARDVVHAIDARYRTIPRGNDRAIGGLSEGGYGALNIGMHHPHEFKVIQSWSGYQRADKLPAIFGFDPNRLAFNSPLLEVQKRATALRRAHTFIWFYSGREDRLRSQNAEFAAILKSARVPHRFFLVRGGHNWALWRGNAGLAMLDASRHLAHG
jgi:enterochelin esterase-like enzyme